MSPAQIRAAVSVVATLAETIREVGEVPSGHLYAQVMGTLELQQYEQAIGILKRAELVSESGHVLRWTGPRLPTSTQPSTPPASGWADLSR